MHTEAVTYPVRFSVDYPARPLSRLSTLFRLVVAIPIVIVLGSVGGAMWERTERPGPAAVGAAGLLFFGPLLIILFRRKYPRWWFDWNRELLRFSNRVCVFLGLNRCRKRRYGRVLAPTNAPQTGGI